MKERASFRWILIVIPVVLVLVVAFPSSGTREFVLFPEWKVDKSAAWLLPGEPAGEGRKSDVFLGEGGLQWISADGRRGHAEQGDIQAVAPGYRVRNSQDGLELARDDGTVTNLGRASILLAREHVCAVAGEDGFTVTAHFADGSPSVSCGTTDGVGALEVVDATTVVIGTLSGRLLVLAPDGSVRNLPASGGSRLGCIYGLCWLPGDSQLLVLSGLYPQQLQSWAHVAGTRDYVPGTPLEMPFAVRSGVTMMPVFSDRSVLFDLEGTAVLYEPATRLFHAVRHDGALVNAVMLRGTGILALGVDLDGSKYRVLLLKPDGRLVGSLEYPGLLEDFAASPSPGLLVLAGDVYQKLRWSLR